MSWIFAPAAFESIRKEKDRVPETFVDDDGNEYYRDRKLGLEPVESDNEYFNEMKDRLDEHS